MPPLLEVCVGDPASLRAAVEGGADRIELCSALELGGLTPTPGLMRMAARTGVPVYAMVRPRAGDFVFDPGDVEAMLEDLAAVRAAELAGVVLGASCADGSLDGETLRVLVRAALGFGLTLHRAFDLVADLEPAVELAVALGFERILTSGRAPSALEGVADLQQTQTLARGRIAVMAGAGLSAGNVGALLTRVPLDEVHGSCASAASAPDARLVRLGFAPPGPVRRTNADEVRRFKAALLASASRDLSEELP